MTGKRLVTATRSQNIIRDAAISSLGAEALKDGAIVAAVIYETGEGTVVIRSHDGSRSTLYGLLHTAAMMEGIIDD
jgi:hypothetical protein